MNCELYRLCGLDSSESKESRLFLIREGENNDATFAVIQLAYFYLRNNGNVCFISFGQSYNHYASVSTKLGLTLKNYEEENKFIFKDGLKYLANCEESQRMGKMATLKKFYMDVCSTWKEQNNHDIKVPAFLIIDHLSVLETIGYKEIEISDFVKYLQNLVQATQGNLLLLIHSDHRNIEDYLLGTLLGHRADVIMDIDKLTTGYCKEIDGDVISIKRDQSGTTDVIREKMHYKLEDKNVNYIAPGTSAAVL